MLPRPSLSHIFVEFLHIHFTHFVKICANAIQPRLEKEQATPSNESFCCNNLTRLIACYPNETDFRGNTGINAKFCDTCFQGSGARRVFMILNSY